MLRCHPELTPKCHPELTPKCHPELVSGSISGSIQIYIDSGSHVTAVTVQASPE